MSEAKLHILLLHQAFVALNEAGGTRHYEMASHLARRGHRVTVIASQTSYLTGTAASAPREVAAGGKRTSVATMKIAAGALTARYRR